MENRWKGPLLSRLVPGLLICLCALLMLGQGCASVPRDQTSSQDKPQLQPTVSSPMEKWGVEVRSIRLTSFGQMVDFRYRIIDPEKASILFAKEVAPYLVDEASGMRLSIPTAPIVGSLRAKGKPEIDRDYFILFGNSRGIVKKGNKVTVVAGDFKVENLTVE